MSNNNITTTMTNFIFEPGYYEWHLTTENDPENVIFYIIDPADDEDLIDWCSTYEDVENYVTFKVDKFIEDENEQSREPFENFNGGTLPQEAIELMARMLYQEYVEED